MKRIPAWGYVVGILMLLFGLLGLVGDVQSLFMGELMDFQKGMMNAGQQEASWEEEFDEGWQAAMDSLAVRHERVEELDDLEELSAEDPSDSTLVHQIDSLKEQLGGADGYDEVDRAVEMDPSDLENIGKVPQVFSNMFHMSEYTETWLYRFGIIGIFINLLIMTGGIFLMVIRRFSLALAIGALSISILVAIVKIVVLVGDGESGFLAKTQWLGEVWSIFLDVALLIVVLVAPKGAYTGKEAPRVLHNTSQPADEF